MIPRLLGPYLRRDAGLYPVVTLTGPRQSGKTTLCRAVFPDHDYRSLELPDQRLFAREDPRGFLAACEGPVILDEVQHVPELLSYIQVAVDEDPTPGRFVLTGSHNLLLRSQVSQTLAGRSGILHLLPLSRAELDRQEQPAPVSSAALFGNRETGQELWPLLHSGGYPRIHDRALPPGIWLPDYIQTYLERDVRSLAAVGDLATFERFLALCAGRAAQLLNFSALASDTGISVDTARRWISVLQATFVLFLLPPHHRNFNKRMVKTPKLFFHDTGLLCQLLGIREPDQIATHPLRGALFENFVVAEVAKAFLHHRIGPPIFFWRDRTGHEVDLLIDHGTVLQPVEIKSSQTAVPELLDGLRWWMGKAGEVAGAPTLVYAGPESRSHSGIAIRPWFSV
ncbi:MAG TPA: ATP-binding protein [Thermoanaerobaculia bacterium]|nr:ATP-binding protein [Thermoanaerobaculia bacterium]